MRRPLQPRRVNRALRHAEIPFREYGRRDAAAAALTTEDLRLIRFSLTRLAALAGMSELHFNRLFKRATGLPPSRYLIRLRIEAARRLLRETDRSVIAVANEVGYSNPSHFAQVFRRETGRVPSDYRRRR